MTVPADGVVAAPRVMRLSVAQRFTVARYRWKRASLPVMAGLLVMLDYPVNLGRACGTIKTRRAARPARVSGAPTKARLVARPGEPITRARTAKSRVFPAPRVATRQQRTRPFATAPAVGLELV